MAIQLRRGTADRLAEVNERLEDGQPGVETDTGQMKVGNGTDRWNDLPYVGQGCGSVVEGSSAAAGQTSLALSFGTFPFAFQEPGVVVSHRMRMEHVTASWRSTNEPAGPWTLTIFRHGGSGSRVPVATCSINTTNP